ncbi:hypothetical protein ACU686_13905 [Yinghuangia aomiensis]
MHIRIEPLGDHEYLVRFPGPDGEITSRFRATQAVLDQVDVPGVDEARFIEATSQFLTERQPVIDIPPMIDLEDVVAAYGDDYLRDVTRRVRPL